MGITAKEKLAEWDEADRQKYLAYEKEIEAVKDLVNRDIEKATRCPYICNTISVSRYFCNNFGNTEKTALAEYYKTLGWVFTCRITPRDTLYWELSMRWDASTPK